jgi:hypothetical protein
MECGGHQIHHEPGPLDGGRLGAALGDLIAKGLGRDRVLVLGLVALAALLLLVPRTSHMVPIVIAFGLAGPIVSLPGDVRPTTNRAPGMGVFQTLHHATMLIAPAATGSLAEAVGTVDTAFALAADMVALSPLLLVLSRGLARHAVPAGIAP